MTQDNTAYAFPCHAFRQKRERDPDVDRLYTPVDKVDHISDLGVRRAEAQATMKRVDDELAIVRKKAAELEHQRIQLEGEVEGIDVVLRSLIK